MPDANGFWTAAEQAGYRGAGDGGEAPGTTDEQRQATREQTYGTQTYTDPTGKAVRGWEGSWQADPLAGAAGGSLWMPGEAGRDWGTGSASRANPAGMSTFLRDIAPDTFGANTNIQNILGGRGLYGGMYNPGGESPAGNANLSRPIPSRSRARAGLPADTNMAAASANAAQQQGNQLSPEAYQNFQNWFQGRTNWEPGSGMVDTTSTAPFDPRTGQSTGGPVSFGDLYQGQGVGPPVVGRQGQSFLPGYQNLGIGYNTQLMQSNPGLFMAELQQQQLQNPRQTVSGTPSPWLPPQLTGGQAMSNPAPAAYAQQGIHQGPGAFRGPGGGQGPGMGPGGQPAGPMGPGQGPQPGHQGGPSGQSQAGSQQQQMLMNFLSQLFGGGQGMGGGSPFGNPLSFGGQGGQQMQGVAQLLAFIQSLRGQFGGVGQFQQRPPARGNIFSGRGAGSYLYPAGYGPAQSPRAPDGGPAWGQ